MRRSLQWRHNEHNRRLKSPASRLFTRPFIQGTDKRKHQSSTSLAFVRGIHRGPANSLHKWPVTWKMFPLDDVIMYWQIPWSLDSTFSSLSELLSDYTTPLPLVILHYNKHHFFPDKIEIPPGAIKNFVLPNQHQNALCFIQEKALKKLACKSSTILFGSMQNG